MYTIARVVIENATYSFDKEYSYFVPDTLVSGAVAGCRVRVPFGGGNRVRTGLILAVENLAERDKRLKPLAAVLDDAPLLTTEGLWLLRYLKECTFCTWFDALRTLVPAGLSLRAVARYRFVGAGTNVPLTPLQEQITDYLRTRKQAVEETRLRDKFALPPEDTTLDSLATMGLLEKTELLRQRVGDEKQIMVRLIEKDPDSDDLLPEKPLTKRQKTVVAFLEENGGASLREVCYYNGITRAVTDTLAKNGVVEYYDVVTLRNPYSNAGQEALQPPPPLSAEQEEALASLSALLGQEKPGTALLYGVTGSGKTQVFLALMSHVLARGQSVLVLVPEIALTAQTMEVFHSRFGKRVAVLHSGLSLGERMDEWRRIRDGGADIVVGTRSAVFAPLANIGLIVLDEEQEHTYHSEKSPRFHAREVAKARCHYHGGLLVLASATPSVETYHHAKEGRYTMVTLTERFGTAQLPDVYTVDMSEPDNLSASPLFSQRLLEELHYNLEHGEQSILLLNRRGYSTLVQCSSCGTVEECPNCSVSMTYHNVNNSLICHYCGYTKEKPALCQKCGSALVRFSGTGTQKITEELEQIFSSARILRVDMDTTLSKFSHQRLFHSFLEEKYDIMVGTQMVAKGLNFPKVTLVGVLAVDQALYATDFRSYEHSFSLLTQVIGRSGRDVRRGRAIVQTYSPDHPIIGLAAQQDYPQFFAQEIASRRYHLYPPFCDLAGIGFVGQSLEEVRQWARRFLQQFRILAADYPDLPIRVLGPVDADTLKVAGKYRQKLILKCKNNRKTRALLRDTLAWFSASCKTVNMFIDMHYDRI